MAGAPLLSFIALNKGTKTVDDNELFIYYAAEDEWSQAVGYFRCLWPSDSWRSS